MLAATTARLRALSHGMHGPSEKMWEGHGGQILRNKRHFILRNSWNGDSWALCACLESWFCSDRLCRWYRVCQVRWTMLLRCYLRVLWELISAGHARQSPSNSYVSVSEVNWDGRLDWMSSQQTSKKRHEQWGLLPCGIWYQVETW